MNKFMLLGVIAAVAIPAIGSARQGMDDMSEHRLPPLMNQSGATWTGEVHHDKNLPPMMGSGKRLPIKMEDWEKRPPMMGSGGTRPPMNGSGEIKPPKGPGFNNQEINGLSLAIGKLPPEKRKELLNIIKKYLEENSVKPGNSQKEEPKTGSWRNSEGKKEYVGHVSLLK